MEDKPTFQIKVDKKKSESGSGKEAKNTQAQRSQQKKSAQKHIATTVSKAKAEFIKTHEKVSSAVQERAKSGLKDDVAQSVKQIKETAPTQDILASYAQAAHEVGSKAKREAGLIASQVQSQVDEVVDKDAVLDLFEQTKASIYRYCQTHKRQVIYGCVGFLIALGVLWIGLSKVLLIGLLTFIGVAIGQYVDGKPYILRFFTDFIKRQ